MAYCSRCQRWFPHAQALEQHTQNSSFHWVCDPCNLDFKGPNALQQHFIQSPKHHYCEKHNESEASLRSHYDRQHDLCPKCGDEFDDVEQFWEHAQRDHYACLECYELFDTYAELQSHDRDVHTTCTDCHRVFQNDNNLRQHLKSKIHQPANVRCPGRGCNRLFISHAALTLHFEAGTCPSGMTREELNRLVVRFDRNNYITNPTRLLTGPQGQYQPRPPAKTWATLLSWNGVAFECFLCHATFRTLAHLNQHLQSPIHAEKIYRCPKSDCRIEFATLSGLCQHVEHGSCGVRMFKSVRDVMEGLTKGFNTITL
ncbi:hypothetical protein F5148DRAFT_424882 [Russula earlei]|uniref:Uncharacterized protein n=1 Tax=Russula earlei TaxID=71964 RepID=A0ACC0TZ59_9AGAM|nr:hypothetical protein F5148DRAFT_424882 [Russula earlei]